MNLEPPKRQGRCAPAPRETVNHKERKAGAVRLHKGKNTKKGRKYAPLYSHYAGARRAPFVFFVSFVVECPLFGGLTLSCRDDLEPITIRVGNEVNPHGGVFIADTAHRFMQRMGSGKVIHSKRDMDLIVA